MDRSSSASRDKDEGRRNPSVNRETVSFSTSSQLTSVDSWDSLASPGAGGRETDTRFLKTGVMRHGLLRFDIPPVTSDGFIELRFAFSDDGTRLLTWDSGCFRAWQTNDFAMQCCSRYRTKKSVLSVRFDGQSSSTFAALFADWSVSTYAVRNAATGMEIKECPQLSNVDEDEREVIDSEDGTRTEFLETELSASALSRAISALNAPDWKEETVTLLSAKEAARHMLPSTDFPRDIAPFCVRVGRNGGVLVVVVEDGHAGDNDNTYVQLHHSDTENGRQTVERLGGSDGRFAGDGQFIVSWDGCTSNAPENRRSVYVYKTSDIVQNKPSTGRQLINLFRKEAPEMHAKRLNVPKNTVILEARLLLDQSSSSRRPTQLATASLLMLCQVNWSATAKIFVMSLKTETVCFRLDFGMSFIHELESPKELVKRLSDQSLFVLSPNQRWIYLSKHDQKKGTVYSVKDGCPVLEVDWSDDDDFEPLRSKFDSSGRYLVLEDGKRVKVFVLNENEDIVDSAIREVISPDAHSVLGFYAQYDGRKLGKMLSEALSLRGDLGHRVTTMLGDGLFAAIRDKIEAVEHFVDVIISPDRSLVAFMAIGKTACIEIYSWEKSGQSHGALKMMKSLDVPDLVLLDSYGDRVGMFTKRGDCREFTYLNPQAENVFVVKVNVDDGSTPHVSELSKKEGTFLSVMKLTADGSKALVVYHNGQFLVLSLEKGIRTWMKGSFACETGVHNFVDHFLRDAFIHISEDDKMMTIGWDSVAGKPLSIPLEGRGRTTAAAINKVVRNTPLCNLGNVVWMNRSRTRVIVSATRKDVEELLVYDISGSRNTEIKRIPAVVSGVASVSSEPCLAHSRTLTSCRNLTSAEAFVASVVLLWQEALPHYSVLDLFDIELDDDIAQRLIDKFGANLINTAEGQGGSLIHYAVTRGYLGPANLLFEFATERHIPVKLSWGSSDLLGHVAEIDDPDPVRFVLEKLLNKCASASETARLLSQHFEKLLKKHRHLVIDHLEHDRFCCEYGTFLVPERLFDGDQKMPIAMTDNNAIEWQMSDSEARDLWKRNHPVVAEHLSHPSGTQIPAVARVICFEQCVRRNRQNFLRHVSRAKKLSPSVFKSKMVISLVQWLWYKYFKCCCIFSICLHLAATFFFSLFIVWCDSENKETQALAFFFLLAAIILQLSHATQSLHFRRTCTLFLVAVYIWLHYSVMFVYDSNISSFLAFTISLESIFMWLTVLQYCQPFELIGPLVILTANLVDSIVPFILLFMTTTFGFSLAFRILFSEMLKDLPEERNDFDSTIRIAETLFFSTIGNIEADVFYLETKFLSVWRSLLYVVFLFVSMIVLFNLMVAILTDAYDRAQMAANERKIKARADIVVTWNSLYYRIGKKLNREGAYFHYLVPADDSSIEREDQWEGRMNEVSKMLRSSQQKTKDQIQAMMASLQKQMEEMEQRLTIAQRPTDAGNGDN